MSSYTTPTITAKIIADSLSHTGVRLTTFEIEYPRFILAELNTHRILSKNSASSRAIPTAAMYEHIKTSPAMPVHWGKNQAGMQAEQQLDEIARRGAEGVWLAAMDSALSHAHVMSNMGLHKQVVNRITEPWMTMKTVISGTEWANFWHLRNHRDAQPEIHALAAEMYKHYLESKPLVLFPGEWHVPYITTTRDPQTKVLKYSDGIQDLDAETAKKVSASCCAQVSYRKSDLSVAKAEKVFERLIYSQPVHASPVEHQATPIEYTQYTNYVDNWPLGVTHRGRSGHLWSGNFRDWIQHRKMISGEAVWDYE
jgi:thymidylate synthase ThyX